MIDNGKATQIPIFRFINRHKWVIIVPIILCTLYFGLPRSFYRSSSQDSSQKYFSAIFEGEVNSSNGQYAGSDEKLLAEIESTQRDLKDASFLKDLIVSNNLFESERSKGIGLDELAQSFDKWIYPSAEIVDGGGSVTLSVIIFLQKQDRNKIEMVSRSVGDRLRSATGLDIIQIDAIQPAPSRILRYFVLLKIIFGLFLGVLISVGLILLLESPNLFYSPKIHEEVFIPIRSDWQIERAETVLEQAYFRTAVVDIRFAMAFLIAMVQRNPLSEFFRVILKVAK